LLLRKVFCGIYPETWLAAKAMLWFMDNGFTRRQLCFETKVKFWFMEIIKFILF